MNRIQFKRGVAGFRMPANSKVVTRANKYGNPFKVSVYGLDKSLELYEAWINGQVLPEMDQALNSWRFERPTIEQIKNELGKLDALGCTCPTGNRCHADILIEKASGCNGAAQDQRTTSATSKHIQTSANASQGVIRNRQKRKRIQVVRA